MLARIGPGYSKHCLFLAVFISAFIINNSYSIASDRKLTREEVEKTVIGNTYQIITQQPTELYYIWTKDNEVITGPNKTYNPSKWRFSGDNICYNNSTDCTSFYRSDSGLLGAKWDSEKPAKIWYFRQEAFASGKLGFLQIVDKTINNIDFSTYSAQDRKMALDVKGIVERELSLEQSKYKQEREHIESDPAYQLGLAYDAYIYAKSCFEARKSYASVYVTEQELNEAKIHIKSIESYYKSRSAAMDTDKVWAETTVKAGNARDSIMNFDGTRDLCQSALDSLRSKNKKLNPQANRVVKDF